MPHDPIILALDFESVSEARALVTALDGRAQFYKVGMELYAAAGMTFVRELLDGGKQVFLDLKFHDIGETVKRATAQVAKVGVTFLTVHGTKQVMRAALQGRAQSSLKLLAVTVLTSLDDPDLLDDGYTLSVSELVQRRGKQALDLGMDGVVVSPGEAAGIRAQAGAGLLVVTPGIRSAGSSLGDQKRVATPAQALANGADYLVIGRQVTRANHPATALDAIREEIGTAARSGDAAR